MQKIGIITFLNIKKNEKRAYGNKRYHNMLEEKKQKLKEYQKRRYQEANESKNNDFLVQY